MLARLASWIAKQPTADEAPYMISGVGSFAGDQGMGSGRREKRAIAAVIAANLRIVVSTSCLKRLCEVYGIVAASVFQVRTQNM